MRQDWRKELTEYWTESGASVGLGFAAREEVVAHCLVRWAENIHLMPCPRAAECEGCNIDFGIWWDWHNSLARENRVAVQRVMRKCGIPLPPGPWEVVTTNAVPASLN